MSENKQSFVDPVSESVSTDHLMDLKVGIYNLFVSLINHQVIDYGPEQAVRNSLDFLKEIIYNFEKSIENNNQ